MLSLLYIGTFGSFIGYSAAMPLLIRLNFWVPEPAPLGTGIYFAFYAFLGAGVGSLTRPLGGWLADRLGGARVTLARSSRWSSSPSACCGRSTSSRPTRPPTRPSRPPTPPWFPLFLGFFLCIFAATGIGNGSVYKMIPALWRPRRSAPPRPGTPERTAALTSAPGRRPRRSA